MADATGKDNFVRVPHWVMDYLMTANLNMTQFRIFNTVVRYTFGYNQLECWLSLEFISQLTKCDKRQVRRELKVLIARGIVIDRTEGRKRFLRINKDLKKSIGDSLDPLIGDSLDLYREDSLDPHIKKELKKKSTKEKYYIDLPIDDHVFLTIYNTEFRRTLNKEHPKITEQQLLHIMHNIELLKEFELTEDEFKEGVGEHFKTLPSKNNGNILAFIPTFMRYFEVPSSEFVEWDKAKE
ncbi:replication protein [Paenibacillus sp. 19GGS1-52]|uniref:replication protein n=1 Tax=Paenibacillus sp. 19GGS1-52 TaxID=2758563 RepID=UPI001EFA7B3E|nr:replication protein [Paenibacillus sp. 19GGS1-52]ULO05162.1 replication protein [Paenibacillus sp. 19GGS1-52]